MTKQRPKIGLALSGAAARSAFYIGFLEQMDAHGIPIDAIAAQSGATIIAATYACGTLEKFKKYLFSINKKDLLRLVLQKGENGGGFYSLDAIEEDWREKFTLGKKMEDVSPELIFVAADLERGEVVRLQMGDIAHNSRISSTIPGVFEPVYWGNRTLVDGGLISYIPADLVRESGADIVIGVSVRATKHMFYRSQLMLRDWYNTVKRAVVVRPARTLLQLANKLSENDDLPDYDDIQELASEDNPPKVFSVLGRSIDLAVEASKRTRSMNDPNFGCDILLKQGVAGWGEGINVSKLESLYMEGVQAGKKYCPQIKAYIENYSKDPKHHERLTFITE